MAESERERRARVAREREARNRADRANQQRRIDGEAAEEAAIQRAKDSGDREVEEGFSDLFGLSPEQLQRVMGDKQPDWSSDAYVRGQIDKIAKELRGNRRNRKRALKRAKQPRVKKALKKAADKKKSSCPFVLVILAGTAVSLLWGSVELAQVVVGALAR